MFLLNFLGVYTYNNTSTYSGNFENNLKTGKAKFTSYDGNTYEGDFI